MRITDRIRYNVSRSDLNRLHSRSSKIYKELSSGKRINRPSDDPFGALQATTLSTHKRLLNQYARNIDTARINLYAADNALGQSVDVITEARTTLLTAVSAIGDDKSHSVMADQISQLKEQLFNLANSRVGDTYIFGGFQSTRTPYTTDAITNRVSYRGDEGAMKLEIGEGSLVDTTLKGASAFGGGSATATIAPGAGYTGAATVLGEYDGSLGNVRVTLEVMPGQGGLAKDARYQVSTDDGATFDDNGGLGFSLSELNTTGPLASIGVQLRLPDQSSTFNDGDQVTLQLIDSDAEDVFALFDELELALREFDDVNTLGAADYDGNGISDDQDIDNAVQQVIDDNNLVQNPMTGAELTFYTDQARNKRFSEIANERVQKLLARMDNALNQVSDNQSLVGLGINKVDSADAANVFLHEQVTGTLAQIEDTDFLEAVSELSLVENALQAATSTTSRVVQGISLLDYLS
jgi:flagellar hook-associated protein 3 FlgL